MIDVSLSRLDVEILLAGVSIPYGILYVLPDGIILNRQDGGYGVDLSFASRYSEKELYALYRLLRLDEPAVRMYDGFEPKCEEQLAFEKDMSDYIDEKRERLRKEGKLYYMSEEIADSVNFAILHDIGVKGKGVGTIESFAAEKERRKTEKLDEVVRRLAGIQS